MLTNSIESFSGAMVVVDALGTKERWIKGTILTI